MTVFCLADGKSGDGAGRSKLGSVDEVSKPVLLQRLGREIGE